MKNYYSIKNCNWLVMLLLTLALFSCKKKETDLSEASRFFKPGSVKVTPAVNDALVQWDVPILSSGKVKDYTIQFSQLETFATVDYTATSATNSFTVGDDKVSVRKKYFVRVKANSGETQQESKWSDASSFTIIGEQIFLTPAAATLKHSSVVLSWTVTPGITKITITPPTGAAIDYAVSAGEVAAGAKTITGLTQQLTYTAEIFAGTRSKGLITFTTPTGPPTGANVINVGPTDDLATLIQNAASGTIFVLLEGTKYTSAAAVNIPNNVSLTIYGELGIKPILSFNGITLPATTGTIRFENIDFTGYPNGDATQTKRNYIFNQSTANTTAEINFENCVIRNFVNTPLRIQGTAAVTIDKFIVNKSTVYDIGDNGVNGTYAFINTNVATGKVNNITITNSTFYKIGYGLIVHSSAPSATLTISNNTFYNTTGDGRYFIDYNGQSAGAFTFSNNILAKSLSPANTARGVRFAAATALTVGNSYKTSDFVYTAGGPITGITDYANPSTTLFTDPANANFLIKDATFAGKSTAGDPRWRN